MTPVSPTALKATELAANTTVVVYAEHQPPYIPLPVVKYPDGLVYSEWQPNEEEAAILARGGRLTIRLWQWTFNQPLQPVAVEVV